MKKLLGLFLSLSLITTINAQYSKVNNTNESPYFFRIGAGAVRGKPCLRFFYLYTKEGNIPVQVFKCKNNQYKNGKLIQKIQTDSTGFNKTKTVQFENGIHYLQFIAFASKKYIVNEELHINKKCK